MSTTENVSIAEDDTIPILSTQKRVGSRGRVYLHSDEREQLNLGEYPYGTEMVLYVTKYEDLPKGAVVTQRAKDTVTLCQYGEFTVAHHLRQYLNIAEGDNIWVTLFPTDR